jgi:hypothetical protein
MFASSLPAGKLPDPIPLCIREARFGPLNHVQTDAFNRQNRTIGASEIAP